MHCNVSAIATKKTKIATERDEEKRKIFREQIEAIDPKRLVFLDECGFSLAMYWLYGWAIKSERCVEKVPCQRGVNRSLLGAISLSGMIAFASKTGGYNQAQVPCRRREDFEKFLTDELLPKLAAGSVLVMDNARIHHGGKIEELVTGSDCSVLYLPPYSPDFNPIELAWGWIKGQVRRICPRNDESREQAISSTIRAMPQDFALPWFRKCGILQS